MVEVRFREGVTVDGRGWRCRWPAARVRRLTGAAVVALGLLVAHGDRARAQPPPAAAAADDERDAELRESVHRVEVTVSDYFGRTETLPVVITVFRPPGEGRYPLLVLNHGRAVEARRHLQGRQRYVAQARWFVARGFVVMVPTRIGYGESAGSFDPEYLPSCRGTFSFERKDEALARQIAAVHAFAGTQPYVDARAWLIAGQSLGGYVAVTLARRAPEGLRGAINFAGGFGGNPENRRGDPCGASEWTRALSQASRAATPEPQTLVAPTTNPTGPAGAGSAPVPTLWLYWFNDHYWGAEIPRRWHRAFLEGGGVGAFVQFPAIDGDGHSGFVRRARDWGPEVDRFLGALGLPLQRVSLPSLEAWRVPPPSGFARLEEVDRVPFVREGGRNGYRAWLGRERPRAFAINTEGRWGWASGREDAVERALGFCNGQARVPCALYAVDDAVVWPADDPAGAARQR